MLFLNILNEIGSLKNALDWTVSSGRVLGHTCLTNLVYVGSDLVLVVEITEINVWKRPCVLVCPRGC
jgi:hypothetical protein